MPTEGDVVTSRPPTRFRCRRCGGNVYRAARTARTAAVPGPHQGRHGSVVRDGWRLSPWGSSLGAIGLSFALAFVASWIGGDAEEAGVYLGMLIGMPAFLLLVPVLLVVAALEYAGNRAYRGKSIVASWDVRLDGEDHVVSLPASRSSSPDHAWVDGARIPLSWTPTDVWSARAVLDGGTLSGTLSMGFDKREVTAIVGFFAFSAVLGVAGAGGGPGARFTLQVEGATVKAVPIADGERRS